MPDLFDAELVARVRDEIDGFERQIDAFLASRDDGRFSIAETGAITFSVHLVARSPLLRELSVHPTVVGICADLIGPDVNLYWDQAVYKKPEKPRRFPWHQDNGYTFVEPQQYLTIWVALTDATRDNGCPVVAPRLPPARDARTHLRRPARLGVPARSAGDSRRRDPRRRRRRVLVAHPAPHRPEHDRRGAQGLHPPVRTRRAPRCCAATRATEPTTREPCNAPDRQYPVLVRGAQPTSV